MAVQEEWDGYNGPIIHGGASFIVILATFRTTIGNEKIDGEVTSRYTYMLFFSLLDLKTFQYSKRKYNVSKSLKKRSLALCILTVAVCQYTASSLHGQKIRTGCR
jgi:hypothetical protein